MTDQIAKTESFEDRLKNRIKSDIGDLMTDEELKTIVKRAVEEIFFKEVRIIQPGIHTPDKIVPSLIHEIVKETVTDKITDMTKEMVDWMIKENPAMLQEAVSNVVKDGAGVILMRQLTQSFQMDFNTFEMNVANTIRSLKSQGQL